jgi:DNA-binding winged helix-turn-helix (wHTH) protein
MQAEPLLRFGPYRLGVNSGQLWRGTLEVKLTPKALAVLRCLLEQAGQVVSKEVLFQAVWPKTVVSDAALTACIQELRQMLRDDARNPRYIETVHRRGYRFIAPLTTPPLPSLESRVQSLGSEGHGEASLVQTLDTRRQILDFPLVGRETELVQLHGWWEKALSGERQIVFVTGEPGIGKTTLVEAFLKSLASSVPRLASKNQNLPTIQALDPRPQTLDVSVWLGRGQCIEHYGAGEAYLPILEALGRLCRRPEGQRLIALLHRQAPSWLVQMPALLSPPALVALQRQTQGVTRERMLRELAEAMEALTAERPVVLWLEDLH